jgi:glycosyltransferase 2 family protein
MNKKRTLVTAVVLALLCLLVYLQVHAWKKFDWTTFWSNTSHVNWTYVALSVVIIYSLYVLRAIRWRIFLKPMCEATTARLIAPQYIGFASLALLGRAGEVVRPYLIAKKENLTLTSQLGVWTVERIFDMGSVALMFVVVGFIGDPLWRTLPNPHLQTEVRWSAMLFLCGILVLTAVAVVLRRSGHIIAERLERRLAARSPGLAHGVRAKLDAFTDGLQVISDTLSFVQLFALSLLMWVLVAVSYWLILQAYGGRLAELGPASLLVLMVGAMFGSLLQLPGVGGGSQLATIAVLNGVFAVENEVAVSCGMLIWLATFMSVIPIGLLLAHRERLSLRAVAAAEKTEEAALES